MSKDTRARLTSKHVSKRSSSMSSGKGMSSTNEKNRSMTCAQQQQREHEAVQTRRSTPARPSQAMHVPPACSPRCRLVAIICAGRHAASAPVGLRQQPSKEMPRPGSSSGLRGASQGSRLLAPPGREARPGRWHARVVSTAGAVPSKKDPRPRAGLHGARRRTGTRRAARACVLAAWSPERKHGCIVARSGRRRTCGRRVGRRRSGRGAAGLARGRLQAQAFRPRRAAGAVRVRVGHVLHDATGGEGGAHVPAVQRAGR